MWLVTDEAMNSLLGGDFTDVIIVAVYPLGDAICAGSSAWRIVRTAFDIVRR